MIRIFKLVLLLVVSQVAFGQAPSNYTNINGRYRWIAGMFDSTFHIPKGTTPSLRTGGSTNGGALFYKTADSSLQLYTGTQWLRMLKVGDTTGMLTPYFNSVGVGLKNTGQTVYADTLLLSTRLWRNKGIDSVQANLTAGLATKVNISDTASMLSPYARKNFLNAGTGISYSSTTGTIANTAPDQTVAISAGTGISVSGTYPNFTVTNTSPSSGGTVTSVGTNNGTGITGGTITGAGTLAIDTLLIATRAWRKKGDDSVAALLSGYVPTSRTLTINGTTQDLTADRTWNVGTVTTAAATGGGQVAFFNGSTVLTSISTLYFDGVNKLAIGNSSPDSMLSVTQGAHIQRGVRLSGLPTAVGTKTLRIDASGTVSVADTLTNGISGSGTTNYIPKFTSSSAIGNSNLINDASGNLGLGVTPSAWLSSLNALQIGAAHLFGQTTGTGTVSLGNNAYLNSTPAYIYQYNGKATRYSQYDGQHEWYTAPSGTAGNAITFTQAMTLDASGRLGIGTTSPSGVLHVEQTTTTGLGLRVQRNLAAASTDNVVAYITNNNASDDQATLKVEQAGSGSILELIGTGGTERMRITSGGNVGINTTTPNSILDVAGSVAAAYASKTATYTLTGSDYTVRFDAVTANANLTANLPDATTCKGRIYVIMAKLSSTTNVTLDGNGAQTIGGSATWGLWDGCNTDATIVIQSDGSNWNIISYFGYNSTC